MIPLDATNHAPLTLAFYERLAADHRTPSAAFVHDLLQANVAAIGTGQYYLWDAITATIAIHNEIATFHPYKLRVVEEEGPESGRTVVADQGQRPARVALGVQAKTYEELLLAGLNGRSQSRSVGQHRPERSGLFGW
jgi:inosine-uridine nucleoside N-ribohydrolase